MHLLIKAGKNFFCVLNHCYWMPWAGNLKLEYLNLNSQNNYFVSDLSCITFLFFLCLV